MLLKGIAVKGIDIRTFADNEPDKARRGDDELMEMLASGRITPHVSAVYGLADVAAALHHVADRLATGKVLIRP